jgi:hypothetical protein
MKRGLMSKIKVSSWSTSDLSVCFLQKDFSPIIHFLMGEILCRPAGHKVYLMYILIPIK